MSEHKLCRFDDLADLSGRSFVLSDESGGHRIVVVRHGARVFGYINACPHIGTALDMISDDFVDADAKLLMCALHGARFRIEDGVCVAGPCVGDALRSFPIVVRDGNVYAQA
ncbi:MAG: Rieske (2Fe-2S) protein [Alphaproteobacteria bacterium]